MDLEDIGIVAQRVGVVAFSLSYPGQQENLDGADGLQCHHPAH